MSILASGSLQNNTQCALVPGEVSACAPDAGPVARATRPAPAAAAISLDTRGTSEQTSKEAKAKRRAARRGREHRDLVASLEALGWQTEADKVRSCGRLAVYACGDCGSMAARSNLSCDNRLCAYCCHVRAEKLAHKLVPIVERMSNPVLIVLTVRNGDDLAERDGHLRRSVKKLTRRVAWQRAFAGGIALEEVTHSPAGWHPHLNILVDGYMDQAELSRLWLACTGDSYICHVQYIAPEQRLKGVYEAAKYCAKLPDLVGAPGLVQEFLDHFRGRRMVWAFGSLYGVADEMETEISVESASELVADEEACPICRGIMHLVGGVSWSKQECKPAGRGWWVSQEAAVGPPGLGTGYSVGVARLSSKGS